MIWQDTRRDYGEERFIALGRVGARVHSLVFHATFGHGWQTKINEVLNRYVKRKAA